MFNVLMYILYLLLSAVNLFPMELKSLKPIESIYNNNVSKEDRLVLNNEEKTFFDKKICLWKKIADYYKESLSEPIVQIITTMPGIDQLMGDSDILNYKNIIEQAYDFSPNKVKHLNSKGLIVSEELFRQKLLYLEVLLYNN